MPLPTALAPDTSLLSSAAKAALLEAITATNDIAATKVTVLDLIFVSPGDKAEGHFAIIYQICKIVVFSRLSEVTAYWGQMKLILACLYQCSRPLLH